jgi:uncharacterized sulfatase
MFTRRQILVAPAAATLARAAANRLNVLFVAVDDLNTRLGCYGDPIVKSPNIDRLARQGVRFERGYCNYPLCNPSRTSLLSGRRPETTRILDNNTPPRTTLGDIAFLPEHFRANGYFTARVGKIAHGRFEHFVKWDVSEEPRDAFRGKQAKQAKRDDAANEGGAKLAWRAVDGGDETQPDGLTARRIVQLMRDNAGKPWFLGCGFHKPHLPWVAPKKYFDLYPPDKIPLPKEPPNDREDIPRIALTKTAGDAQMSDLDRRKAIAAYHAATSFMDAQLGFVLDEVDRQKLWDSTIVLLFGDHGFHLAEHQGLWRKMTLFEESDHAPLIVAAPGFRRGAVSPRLVEWVDFYPSLIELCGLPGVSGLEGTSLVPLLREPARAWKKAAYTVVSRGETLGRRVVTERYRYTEWGSPDVAELYDHQRDPKEFVNRVKDPAMGATLREMRRLLAEGWRSALPA